jgi:hypothetical protein
VSRAAVALAAVLAAACTTTPSDPFVVAERSMLRHDLATSLRALDAVPVAHRRYPEARAAAVAVERSMRRCHELMLEAMLLRSEWRDREALVVLRRAEAIWPRLPGVDALIAATEQRLRVLGGRSDGAVDMGASPPASPPVLAAATALDADLGSPLPPVPAAPSAPPAAPVGEAWVDPHAERTVAVPGEPLAAERTGAAVRSDRIDPVAPEPGSGEDPVALGLVAVETRLARNQLEPAVVDLLELSRRFPADARVRIRLVRLLHQRALLRYGEGAVAMAVADWRRLLEIDPQHGPARRMLEAVELEGR